MASGRVGRHITRALIGQTVQAHNDLKLIAVNDLAPIEHSAHLLKYDSIYGQFHEPISIRGDEIMVGDKSIRYFSDPDPRKVSWGELDIDLVLECTGCFASERNLSHLGCRRESSTLYLNRLQESIKRLYSA